jgi:hypothetical protein
MQRYSVVLVPMMMVMAMAAQGISPTLWSPTPVICVSGIGDRVTETVTALRTTTISVELLCVSIVCLVVEVPIFIMMDFLNILLEMAQAQPKIVAILALIFWFIFVKAGQRFWEMLCERCTKRPSAEQSTATSSTDCASPDLKPTFQKVAWIVWLRGLCRPQVPNILVSDSHPAFFSGPGLPTAPTTANESGTNVGPATRQIPVVKLSNHTQEFTGVRTVQYTPSAMIHKQRLADMVISSKTKHKGWKFEKILSDDPGYCMWAMDNKAKFTDESMKMLLKYLEGHIGAFEVASQTALTGACYRGFSEDELYERMELTQRVPEPWNA